MGESGQRHAPATHYPHTTGGCVDPRVSLNTEARPKALLRLPGIEPPSSGRPVRSNNNYNNHNNTNNREVVIQFNSILYFNVLTDINNAKLQVYEKYVLRSTVLL
jgi:hypothetical protein